MLKNTLSPPSLAGRALSQEDRPSAPTVPSLAALWMGHERKHAQWVGVNL